MAEDIEAQQATMTTATYTATLRKVGGQLICVAVQQGAYMLVGELVEGAGIYVLQGAGGKYVGRSIEMNARFEQHVKAVKLGVEKTLGRFYVGAGYEADKRMIEQFFINMFGGKKALLNARDEIAMNKELAKEVKGLKFCP